MSLKNLLVHLDHSDRSAVRLDLAVALARRHGARLVGLFAECGKPHSIGVVSVWPSDAYKEAAASPSSRGRSRIWPSRRARPPCKSARRCARWRRRSMCSSARRPGLDLRRARPRGDRHDRRVHRQRRLPAAGRALRGCAIMAGATPAVRPGTQWMMRPGACPPFRGSARSTPRRRRSRWAMRAASPMAAIWHALGFRNRRVHQRHASLHQR